MSETRDIVLLLSLILGVVNFFWLVWKHFAEKRERQEQKTEKIDAAVCLLPEPCVEIYNSGSVPVFIRGVELVLGHEQEQKTFPLQVPVKMRCLPMGPGQLGKETWQYTGRPTLDEALQQGHHESFGLGGLSPELAAAVDQLNDPEAVHISIYSNAGEIARIPGDQALPWVRSQRTARKE